MSDFIYLWLLFKASLFSTGGTGNLPSLHADLIARGWANEQQFGEALTIGQVSPGPTGLWVLSLGYLTHGLRGSLMALLAIIIPPVLILAVERFYRRVQDHPAVEGFMHGLSLAVVGVFVVALLRIGHSAGVSLHSFVIGGAAIALGLSKRVPLPGIVALAGAAGVFWRG